jgi:uncharacterized protein (TIGR02246 family)
MRPEEKERHEMDDLAERVQRLEDITAIHQLFVDYGAHLDAHDFEAYSQLFADDAEVLLGPVGRAKGRAEIRAMMEKTTGGEPGGSLHLIGNPIVDLQGDTATSNVTWVVINKDPAGQPVVGMMGHHRDKLVRRDGRWYFQRRAGYVDIPSVMKRD